MRITAIKATPVNIPFTAAYRGQRSSLASLTKTIVEVHTDEGLSGIGESAIEIATVTEQLGERLVGLDPLDLNECELRCVLDHSYNLWSNAANAKRAFGGIEMALWDLRGKVEGLPLYKLLGGKVREAIPFTEYFAIRWPPGETSPREVVHYCAQMIEEFDSPFFEGKMGLLSPSDDIALIREIRHVIGDERMIRLDTNCGWSITTARGILQRLEEFRIRNYEDPVDTYDELARLRPYTAASFSTHNPDLKRALALGVPDYFVLNLVELGGIRRTIEFISAARMFGIGFWFHSGETGVANSAYLHVASAVVGITEPSQSLFRWMADDVIEGGPHSPRGGYLPVPEGPGLGVTLDRKALARCHERFRDEGALPSGSSPNWVGRPNWFREFTPDAVQTLLEGDGRRRASESAAGTQ